jgi:transposase InsO family protein
LATVPGCPSPRHSRHRLLLRRHPAGSPVLRPVRRGARHPPRPPPGHHGEPKRSLGRPASTEPADGPRRSRGELQVFIRDRDTKFTSVFDAVFTSEGIRILRTPVQASRANAIAERWIGTLRREPLDRILILHRHHLEHVLAGYVAHFNHQRLHRTLHQAAPLRPLLPPESPSSLRLRRRDRLGGLIHEYAQVA